jgi:putative FmdB family regulatory protein
MPLYEYLCEACGRRTEVLQSFDDPPLAACPHCGGAVKKQFSAPAFHLKGSGWYATDYAKKSGGGESAMSESSKPEGTKSEGSASAGSSGDGSSASPAKPSSEKTGAAAPSSGSNDPKS